MRIRNALENYDQHNVPNIFCRVPSTSFVLSEPSGDDVVGDELLSKHNGASLE